MADVCCVEEHARSVCEHGWQEMYNYRHIGGKFFRQFVRPANILSREVENQNLTMGSQIYGGSFALISI